MAVLKCKMCGGDVELAGDKTFGTCEYCGCTMTFPKVDDDQRAAAFNRGNHFRRIGEFDKALAVYERMVQEDDTDAEAHWCCALCRFGIEYVEDPATMEWLPTCHRASFDSFLEDVDYLAAVKHSAGITQRQYQKDAAKIADVQRGILATSQNTEPYDVFICYKETDEQGNRTKDSTLAQEIYYQLTEQGRRVFFSRITLEDVAGTQYEPYIFAALNSARVMIVVGTTAENLSAVWVKNEWSRFLSLMKKDHGKLLLPCYRDMDPYDLPEQLSVLQSYDMAKIGFIQDLTRGIAKVLDAEKKPTTTVVKETIVTGGGGNVAPLLKRAFMYLEDGEWSSADEYCEKVLDIDPECGEAYLAKLMAEMQIKTCEGLKDCAMPFEQYNNYQKAMRFGDDKLQTELKETIAFISNRNLTAFYNTLVQKMAAANSEQEYDDIARQFAALDDFKDARAKAEECLKLAEEARKDAILANGKSAMNTHAITWCEKAIYDFQSIPGWKDADEQLEICRQKIAELKAEEEQEKQAAKKRKKIIAASVIAVICIIASIAILLKAVIIPNRRYNDAEALMKEGKTAEAAIAFGKLGDYKDAKERSFELWDEAAVRETISAGVDHTVGLKADGTVVAVGANSDGQCDVSDWTDIVAISAGAWHTVGLKADGTVVAVGYNGIGQCDVSDWTDIVAISAGGGHTVGLKADGTVVAVGSNSYGQCDVSEWTNIVAFSAGGYYTVGLKADGTVVAKGDNENGECDVDGWTDIVAVSAGDSHTVGLKADGTVVAVGYNGSGRCDVDGWTDIVAVSAGGWHTVGLKADGTVVAVGYNGIGQCDVSDWTDIVAISAGESYTVGLKADGTVVAVGDNDNGQCDVSDWDLF